jgi:hypothetical protein
MFVIIRILFTVKVAVSRIEKLCSCGSHGRSAFLVLRTVLILVCAAAHTALA